MLLTGSTLSGIDRHDNLTLGSLGSYFMRSNAAFKDTLRASAPVRPVRRSAACWSRETARPYRTECEKSADARWAGVGGPVTRHILPAKAAINNMTPAPAFVGRGPLVSPSFSKGMVCPFDRRRPLARISQPFSHAPSRIFRQTGITLNASETGADTDVEEKGEGETWPGFARYSWTIPPHVRDAIDVSQLADVMLEFGAASASIATTNPIDVASDVNFARTGKISLMGDGGSQSDSFTIEFWMFEYDGEDMTDTNIQAEALARDSLASIAFDTCIADDIGEIQRMIDDPVNIVPDDDPNSNIQPDGAQNLNVNGVDLSVLSSLDSRWAFGDGMHPSTSLAIQGLGDCAGVWASEQPTSLLDYGCGSGILTLAGLALGANDVASVDISDDAIFLTEENLRRNEHIVNKSDRVQVLKSLDDRGNDWEGSFDVVVANIPSNTLIMLLPTLARALKKESGVLLTSGYPTTEQEAVGRAANNCGLEEEESRRRYESGWVLQAFASVAKRK